MTGLLSSELVQHEFIFWPAAGHRKTLPVVDIFHGCVGSLDGSEIMLKESPLLNKDSYFSRKSNYGLNLQDILILQCANYHAEVLILTFYALSSHL